MSSLQGADDKMDEEQVGGKQDVREGWHPRSLTRNLIEDVQGYLSLVAGGGYRDGRMGRRATGTLHGPSRGLHA